MMSTQSNQRQLPLQDVRKQICTMGIAAAVILQGVVSANSFAAERVKNQARPGHDQVQLFSALARGEIRATVIAPDSTRLVLQLHNDTDRPLAIRLPAALGARPVLAQFGAPGGAIAGGFPGGGGIAGFPGNGNIGGNQAGGTGGNQGLGFGMPGAGGNGGGGIGMGMPPGGGGALAGGPGGFFNVLPGKTVKKKFVSVCLDHGKPDPNTRVRYELAPLSELNDQADLPALLARMANQKSSQIVAQLAAWHLANGKTWRDLAAMPYVTANGRRQLRYSRQQIAAAQQLVQRLQAARPKPGSNPPTESQSPGEFYKIAEN